MARFIAIHSTPPQATQEQLIAAGKKVVASLAPGAQWLNSWAVPETDQFICEWEAPDVDAIRTSLEPVKDLFPIETVYEVEWVNPQWYK
jgi:hypothetical protein